MSLYKRGDVWWYKFKFQGQVVRESTHSSRRDIARDAERTRPRELELSVNRIERRNPAPLFRLAAKTWLAEKAGRATKTISGCTQRIAPLNDAFGERLVCDIDREDILVYRADRLDNKKSNRTVNYEVGCLRGILENYGLWSKVGHKITRLRENHDCGRAVSFEDENSLLTACLNSQSPSLYPMFVLAIDTGLRAAELRSIRHSDLVLVLEQGVVTGGEVVVPKSKTEAGTGRSIPLTQRAAAALAKWLMRFPNAGPDSYVFPSHSVPQRKGTQLTITCDVAMDCQVQSWQRAWQGKRQIPVARSEAYVRDAACGESRDF